MKKNICLCRVVAIAMIAALSAKAFAGWTYDGSKTLTDGNWVLEATQKNGQLTLSKFVSANDETTLDLTAAVTKAGDPGVVYTIVATGNNTFENRKGLVTVCLPDTLLTIGKATFRGCTALTTVTPLLPPNLTGIGGKAFSGCSSLTGDVVFPASLASVDTSWDGGANGMFKGTKITSCDMSNSRVTVVPDDGFSGCSELVSVKFPETMTSIGANSFWGCSKLTEMTPFLPDAVTWVGGTAFKDCSALKGELRFCGTQVVSFGKNNNQGTTGLFQGLGIESLNVTAPIKQFANGTTASPVIFNGCKSLARVRLPSTFTTFNGNEFPSCTALNEVVLNGGYVANVNGGTFDSCTDYKVRVFVPRFDLTWESFFETGVTPLTATAQTKFETAYPGQHLPLGTFLSSAKSTKRNVFYTDKGENEYADTAYVIGRPYHIAADTVDYGCYTNFTAAKTITIPSYATYEGTDYMFDSWQLDVETSDRVWEKVSDGSALEVTLTPDAQGRNVRLTVNWKAAGFAIDFEVYGGDASGTVAFTPQKSIYLMDEQVTLEATPAAGNRFCYWMGDVDESLRREPKITLTMTDARTIKAVFDRDHWDYDRSTSTMTDGNWTIKNLTVVSADDGTLDIKNNTAGSAVVSVGCADTLDLAKPIVDANGQDWRILRISQGSAFSALAGLRHLVLPDAIVSFGADTFSGCADLESVTPMFPTSLVSFGQATFYNCTSLTGDVVLASESLALSHHNNNGFGTFQNTKITSLDISAPLGEVPGNLCNGCTRLERVKLPATVNFSRMGTFTGCTALRSVEPFLPTSVVDIGGSTFSNCSAITNELVIAGERIWFGYNNNSAQGPFQGCSGIPRVVIDTPSVSACARVFQNCSGLGEVVFLQPLEELTAEEFVNCTSLSNIYFSGNCPTTINSSVFAGVTDYKVRVFYPRGNTTWNALPVGTVTPWKDLTDAQTNKYWTAYPGGKRPTAMWSIAGNVKRNLWLMPWNPKPTGMTLVFR